MARIRPSKPHRDRPVDYVKALELAEERGEVALAERQIDPSATPDDKARCIVRIYYRSIGGEILACDSAPLSVSAANALERDMDTNALERDMDDVTSGALGTERYRAGDVGPLRSGVRLVTLPSQVREPVVVVDPGAPEVCEAPPAPILTLCEAPHAPPAPRQIFNTYYHEAMAKRTARFQAMHRRPIAA
jgi:hypothetical protein